MPLHAPDGTLLAYRCIGAGAPLVCVPGGPMLPADYLGDLGGLSDHAELVLVDPRGSGASGTPADPATYRCDRLVDDLETLRLHLGLDRVALLGHSAGANVVFRYAERYPDRVDRLVLVTPSTRAVGVEISDEARSEVARSRSAEPWYDAAAAALARVQSGAAGDGDWAAITPFSYGRWDAEVAAYDAAMEASRNAVAAQAFGADGAFDPPATRAALAALDVPVVVVAGSADVGNPVDAMSEVAGLFPRGELVVQEGAGHFPWVDDPASFRTLAVRALSR
ncbi:MULTISPECIES: alpha/beta fold hydrolase [Mumia]|uniref:alpha/beta fold hydrolase n=1 Tax=Mumia TaxID=1546255 RepID=UPI0014212E6C|nr:alpha/beta hydrolase [Mumia sp. ZJ1417]QMW65367.1 alpha/beta hydrolase [Mumia sp. ZJ1417]